MNRSIRVFAVTLMGYAWFLTLSQLAAAEVRDVSGRACELDIDGNGYPDLFVLIDLDSKYRFIALLQHGLTYRRAYIEEFGRNGPRLSLSCHTNTELETTSAGEGKPARKKVSTPGGYVELAQPEGAAAAFYFQDNGLRKVWISD
jgi:hypothetical protein